MPSSIGLMNSFGIVPPLDLVLEDVAGARLAGNSVDLHVAVLAAAAGLLRVPHLAVGRTGERLLVGDLRLADARLDAELALQTVDDDLEVQLAHAGDDDLTGLLVGLDAEGRVLGHQLLRGRRRASPGRSWSSARSPAR